MADKKNDNVNHPQHYISANGLETIDVIEAWTDGLEGIEAVCTANVIKYISRWKKKNGIEDLEKARWYLDKLINSSGTVRLWDSLDENEKAYIQNDIVNHVCEDDTGAQKLKTWGWTGVIADLEKEKEKENTSDKVDQVIRGIVDTYDGLERMAKINGANYTEGKAKKVADGAYAAGGSPILNSHYLSLEDLFCSVCYAETPKHISDMWDQFINGECWLVFRDTQAWDYMVEWYETSGRKQNPLPHVWHGCKSDVVLNARWSPFEIEYNDKFIYDEFMVTCRNGELWWEIPEYDWMRTNRAGDGKPIYYAGIESFCEIYPTAIMPLTAPVTFDQYSNKIMYTIDACTDEATVKEFIHGKTVWVANSTRGVDELVHYLGCGHIGRTYGPSRWPNRKPLVEWSPIQYNKGLKPGDDKYLTIGSALCFWVEEEDPRVLHWGLPPEDYRKLGTIGGKPFVMLITSED